jgi:hypothetical protein
MDDGVGSLDLVDLVAQTAEVRSRDPGGSTGPEKPGLGREEPCDANYRIWFSHSLSADWHGQRRELRVAPRATIGGRRILRSSWAGGPGHPPISGALD